MKIGCLGLVGLPKLSISCFFITLQHFNNRNCHAAIPYLANPRLDPQFRVYFSKEWFDALHLSFRNFLSEVFNGTHILEVVLVTVF